MAEQELMNFLTEQFGRMGQGFDAMDQRFEKIEVRLDSMDQRFDAMDQRFDAMDQRFEKIEVRLDSMDQRFDAMDQRFDALELSQQEDIVTLLKVIDKKLDHIPHDIDYLRNVTSKHDMDIERIKKQVGS
ncbi:hypothetical protein [Alteribacter populi]|uniref:hypothetical protein n=1 Tax=Alteribacter populi TaxID=2011011 RepID=UPI000BBB3E1F|nr:hypothetical protein [Alteribacter populi]